MQEVIGYILAFFLSTVVLLFSMNAFTVTRGSSQLLQAAAELELVANTVASHVARFSTYAEVFPNATASSLLRLPAVSGVDYYVALGRDNVSVNTTDGRIRTNATTFAAGALSLAVDGTAHAQGGLVRLCYWLDDQGDFNTANDVKHLRIQDGRKACGGT